MPIASQPTPLFNLMLTDARGNVVSITEWQSLKVQPREPQPRPGIKRVLLREPQR